MMIRFTEEHGGHPGLINKCDFDPARHIRIEDEEPAKAPKGKPAKPAKDE
jgi:hypothetical protein